MKLSTRSLLFAADDPMIGTKIAQSIIECYQAAQATIQMPKLTHIEKRIERHDISFVLTFEPMNITRRIGDDAVIITFS